jgi:hypothetical protein
VVEPVDPVADDAETTAAVVASPHLVPQPVRFRQFCCCLRRYCWDHLSQGHSQRWEPEAPAAHHLECVADDDVASVACAAPFRTGEDISCQDTADSSLASYLSEEDKIGEIRIIHDTSQTGFDNC